MDFSFVEDTAEGIKLISKGNTDTCEAFNITRGQGRSLNEVIDVLRGLFPNLKVSTQQQNDTIYPKRGALDIGKANSTVGYNPSTSIEQGIEKYVEYLLRA